MEVYLHGLAQKMTDAIRQLADTLVRLNRAQHVARLGDYALDVASGELVWSDMAYEVLGFTPGSVAPSLQNFFANVHPDDLTALQEQMRAAMAAVYRADQHGQARLPDLDYRVVHPDGSSHWLHSEAIADLDASGHISHLAGTVQDITHRKNAELQLQHAKAAAEQANHIKTEFLSRMSHELRTPMNAIMGFAQLLHQEALLPDQRDFVEEIDRASAHLLVLINELLDLSHLEVGKLHATLQAVNVIQIINETIQTMQPLMTERRIAIRNDCQRQVGVMADPRRLKQILSVLLTNAIKYNYPKGRVTLNCQIIADARLRLSVTDTGPGIAPEQLPLLFKPFERLGAEAGAEPGAGIGLALAKQFADLMDAEIGVDSAPGRGSTFWIDLMLTPDALTQDASVDTPIDIAIESDSYKILYIEDNAANQRVVEAMFRHEPSLTLLTAATGEHGLELAQHHVPDAILLDIHLPGMDGYAVLQALHASPRTRDIPVIALSADAMPFDVDSGLTAGFIRYLTKPVRLDELMEVLLTTLQDRVKA